MATIIHGSRRIRFYAAAIALAALAITVLAVAYATGPAQAQPDPNLNTGKYANPQPCGLNVSDVPGNPDGEFNEGHVALFDAYWDYNTQTLNNNLCPPLAVHTVVRDDFGDVTGVVTARAQSNIDINETVFHAGNEFRYTITAADKDKYKFLPPAGTQVWWLKQDDPLAEAQAGGDDDEPELVLGVSAGLFKKQDWFAEKCDQGVCSEVEPLQYEFEAERDPEGNVVPFVVFENGAEKPIWDSRKIDSTAIPLEPGEYKHYNWMFFPGAGQSHTYVLEVHLKGHVRTERAPGITPDKWQPLTWPIGDDAPAYDPDKKGEAFENALKDIEKVVTSEVGRQRYTIHVGPLHLNEQPRFGVLRVAHAGAAPGTLVGDPIPMYGADRDQLHYTLEGDGHEDFTVLESEGIHVGVNAQLAVAGGADLSYAGDDPANPEKAYYDLLLNVSDRHDHEDGSDQATDDVIPVRIYVVPSSGPWIALSFKDEHPQVGQIQQGFAQVKGLPAGATMSHITVYDRDTSGQKQWLTVHNGSELSYRFRNIMYHPGSQNLMVVADYQLNGETKTVTSGIYPMTWRR